MFGLVKSKRRILQYLNKLSCVCACVCFIENIFVFLNSVFIMFYCKCLHLSGQGYLYDWREVKPVLGCRGHSKTEAVTI